LHTKSRKGLQSFILDGWSRIYKTDCLLIDDVDGFWQSLTKYFELSNVLHCKLQSMRIE